MKRHGVATFPAQEEEWAKRVRLNGPAPPVVGCNSGVSSGGWGEDGYCGSGGVWSGCVGAGEGQHGPPWDSFQHEGHIIAPPHNLSHHSLQVGGFGGGAQPSVDIGAGGARHSNHLGAGEAGLAQPQQQPRRGGAGADFVVAGRQQRLQDTATARQRQQEMRRMLLSVKPSSVFRPPD